MVSPNILRQSNKGFYPAPLFQRKSGAGFTLIEIIIVVAIFVIVFGFGLFISMDFYKSYSLSSEKSIIVSILQKARSQSLYNINQTSHGVHFDNPLKYIIFECASANPQCTDYATGADTSKDIPIQPSYGITIVGIPFDVMFEQLSGASFDKTITVSDKIRSYDININNEGRIDW